MSNHIITRSHVFCAVRNIPTQRITTITFHGVIGSGRSTRTSVKPVLVSAVITLLGGSRGEDVDWHAWGGPFPPWAVRRVAADPRLELLTKPESGRGASSRPFFPAHAVYASFASSTAAPFRLSEAKIADGSREGTVVRRSH
jgi:hypothetical protein